MNSTLILALILIILIISSRISDKKKTKIFTEQINRLHNEIDDLKNEKNEIVVNYRKLRNALENRKNDLQNQLDINKNLSVYNKELVSEKEKLEDELRFYTEIKEESLKLNDISKKDFRVTIDANTLNQEQNNIYEIMNNTEKNMFITGKAGTGKSYLLRCFKDNTKKKVLYCAPTGVAAINIGAVTIHSAFGYSNINNGAPYKISNNIRTLLENIDAVVIDEISMVRSDYFTRIDEMLKEVRNNNEAFGGVQMIVIGDVFQLPPVVTDGEVRAFLADKYNGVYFFNTDVFKNGAFSCYELETIVRQNDKDFIKILNSVREGNVSVEQIDYLNKRYVDRLPDNSRIIRIVPTKKQASTINTKEMAKIKAREYTFDAQVTYGTEKIVENEFPCDFKLKLKLGCLIMMLVNDNQERRYVNGTLGIVSDINENMIKVSIDGCEYEISRVPFVKSRAYYDREKKEIVYEDELVIKQFPLIPAYALTVHKSQGATYQTVAIDVNNTFSTGQTYVSLSRCANYDKLYLLTKITPDTILVDNEVVNFYNSINLEK